MSKKGKGEFYYVKLGRSLFAVRIRFRFLSRIWIRVEPIRIRNQDYNLITVFFYDRYLFPLLDYDFLIGQFFKLLAMSFISSFHD